MRMVFDEVIAYRCSLSEYNYLSEQLPLRNVVMQGGGGSTAREWESGLHQKKPETIFIQYFSRLNLSIETPAP